MWADDWFWLFESWDKALALAETGLNLVFTHFYTGFVLETGAEEIVDTVRLIANYHRQGVIDFTYIQYDTVMPETIQGTPVARGNGVRSCRITKHEAICRIGSGKYFSKVI